MRTVFIHGETERFEAARFELITLFTQHHPDQVSAELAMLLLRDKLAADGLLAHWTEADVVRFLAEVAPRRVVLSEDWSQVPRFAHRWLDFLAEEGLLAGDPLTALHEAVDAATPRYLAGMAEPTEWGAEKFWRTALLEHGVDESDEDAVAEFAAQVERGEVDVDEDLVDRLEEDSDDEAVWLPPVQLTGEGPHREIAADAPIVEQVAEVIRWAETDGDPSAADSLVEALGDTETADLLLEWCARAGLLRMSEERIVPTLIAAPVLAEPELLWNRLWQRFVLVEDAFAEQLADAEEDAVPEIVQTLLSALYAATEPVPEDFLVDFAADALELDDTAGLASVVRTITAQWAAMDAVVVDDEDERLLEMRPAGRWAARESLRAFGFRVPTVAELRTAPAELVALLFAEAPPQTQQALCTQWISHRGAKQAATDLAELLERVDEPPVRLAALAILEYAGDEGIAAARGLVDDERCGATVRVWLGAATGESIARPGDELALTLDGMAATAEDDVESFVEEFAGQPTEDQLKLIGEMAASAEPAAGALLSALAELHPDQEVAEAASAAMG
ncbi:hypothetical protein [Saccharopolyspora griseoalba]|uniref:HEAT repeat domain-containing protein n=1 Tax=Saccharopolyspora griseoalba TaxID=1431848 RepID=A0ABW2LJR7_9PSEU